ncbi:MULTISPECIES: hypothetical protein [Xenorhabdus]|uniref:Phage coat protein n=1 Tax=Xenorhabdus yunnanensis TaxID=3025878 RepID=A0ABT5LCX7_9GAMM|nr:MULTISPECIES: hypothetical protein [Xenorhabdus]MDC9588953.1 hypothetical protein [Xenorhabdus yunnanensis]PHM69668.1 hypothetical protein Xekj_02385 [Xenorhabdus sp. KJ12.1]
MKIKNIISRSYLKASVVASVALSSAAFANDASQPSAGYLDVLLKQIDVAPIITGVVGVAAIVMGISVTIMGLKKVSAMIKSF